LPCDPFETKLICVNSSRLALVEHTLVACAGDSVDWPIISKKAEAGAIPANLAEYQEACRDFSWNRRAPGLRAAGGRGINIAYEAVDRHVAAGRGAHIALRWLARRAMRSISAIPNWRT